MSVAWVGAGIAAVGVGMSASSASKAQKAQEDAANQANGTLQGQSAQSRADNAPFLANGTSASNALAYRMGANPTTNGAAVDYSVAPTTYIQGQSNNPLWEKILAGHNAAHHARFGINMNRAWDADPDAMAAKGQLNAQYKAALATDPEMQALIAKQSQVQTTANADPQHGSLLRNFTVDDFNADPVNQLALKFGLEEGVKGIQRQAAANSSNDSGAVLKALTRFTTGHVNSFAGESANRFNVNRDSQFNKLAAQAGTGQVATQQVGTTGMNAANNISQNQIGVGNARGASAIATGNALSGAAAGGYNSYQQNRLINGYLGNSNSYGYTTPNWNDPGTGNSGWTSQG